MCQEGSQYFFVCLFVYFLGETREKKDIQLNGQYEFLCVPGLSLFPFFFLSFLRFFFHFFHFFLFFVSFFFWLSDVGFIGRENTYRVSMNYSNYLEFELQPAQN